MATSFDRPLVIQPQRSRWLTAIIVFSHLAVLVFTLTLLALSILPTFALTALVSLSLIYYYRRHISASLAGSVLQAKHLMPSGVHKDTDAVTDSTHDLQWHITLQSGKHLHVRLLPSSFVSNYLVILIFSDQQKKRYSLIVAADAVPADQFRQLKIRVRLYSGLGQ